MATYHCPNLTIIEESEITSIENNCLGSSIIVRLPPETSSLPNDELIQAAIHDQSGIRIPLQKFCHYRHDLILRTNSVAEATAVLEKPHLSIDTITLVMMPCTIDYDALTLPIDPSLPLTTDGVPTVLQMKPKQQILIKIRGLPPQLSDASIVQRLFTNICILTNIEFDGGDSSFSAKTFASKSTIPSNAFIGIRIRTSSGPLLYFWPLWYSVDAIQTKGPATPKQNQTDDGTFVKKRNVRLALFDSKATSAATKKRHTALQPINNTQTGTKSTPISSEKNGALAEVANIFPAKEKATSSTAV